MIFGAHISVAKGYPAAVDYAAEAGCECIQLFAKSPRQWRGPAIDTEAAGSLRDLLDAAVIGPAFTHTAYLINLSTDNDELREKSIDALADEMRRGAALRVDGVVTHVGNDPAGDPSEAARRAGRSIAAARERAGSAAAGVRLLLENTAGAGRTYGGSLDELAAIIAEAGEPARTLGVCFDTCHGFAYGYDLTGSGGWDEVLEQTSALLGLERLGLIHANDCMFERGTHKDRHAWIGDGHIGHEGFRAMICSSALDGVPVVTEMPGEIPEKDVENLARLKRLRAECRGSQTTEDTSG